MNEIDEVRLERDLAKAENIRLREENGRLTELLSYANAAVREEYRLRFAQSHPQEEGVK